ncbi:MAG TPA: tetratricopeptide repeat protein [Actinomycetota bacterium]|nr:tetratricopeptide repeat protein [Actinomycetota bacterium]
MSLNIYLLGRPRVEIDGTKVEPRGRKAWGLLAYLASSRSVVSREQLASLLFADADDPLGALRWNLAELRKLLGLPHAFKGTQIELDLPPGSVVDIHVIDRGTWADAIALPHLERELLEGISFGKLPAFEAWLLNERRHLRASAEAILREAALVHLGQGSFERALDFAARLVAVNSLDEEYQALLIRVYSAAGDRDSADKQLASAIELFRRELGIDPSPALMDAHRATAGSATAVPAVGSAAARAQLDAGKAAIDAGALEAGLECIRRAVLEASGDARLKAEALFAMGSAMVHSGRRPLQEEGAAALHEAIALIIEEDDFALAAAAHRELAWLEILAGRYGRAEGLLARSGELAGDSTAEHAAIESVLGMGLSDVARYEEAMTRLRRSIELALDAGDEKRAAFSLAMLGRALLLRGELDEAVPLLEESLAIVEATGWIGFRALPEAFLGEAYVRRADYDRASELLEHSFALGCRLGDACYESAGARGLGMIAAAHGNLDEAKNRLMDARMRLVARPDYMWIEAWALEGLCDIGSAHGLTDTGRWLNDLESLAGRTGMRELLARTYLYRSRLGDHSALEVARAVASDIDNPHLTELVETGAETKAAI